ncbi:hypothetical protein PAV_11c00050 [Paenibacillus alvei DSM 29]|nr:hypothetical protein PAV_11c00050 [Paenibacillus alvei DSM 29]
MNDLQSPASKAVNIYLNTEHMFRYKESVQGKWLRTENYLVVIGKLGYQGMEKNSVLEHSEQKRS